MTLRGKCNGAKHTTEAMDLSLTVVGERSNGHRSMTGRTCGALGSENAGMSSEKTVRILSTENLRFPEEGSSAQGKSGPKPRPKGVDDGQQVEIPVPPHFRLSNGGTQ